MSPARGRRPGRFEDFPPKSRPRPVEGGLAARSTRGEIGERWWSQRFIAVLESFALGSRLTRGKNYARRGQVISLDVGPGAVTATVQGSRRAPYRVRIGITPLSELVWAKVEVALAEQAIFSAGLLAGDMPIELEQVFAGANAPLFPQAARDMQMSCSCPDWEVPCKHISATFYLLAEKFDDDPFQILHWRGRDRAVLLDRLRQLRSDEPSPSAGGPELAATGVRRGQRTPPPVGAATALADLPVRSLPDMALDPAAYWIGDNLPPIPSHPPLPVDLVLRQLPAPAAILGGADLLADLERLYHQMAEPIG